MTAKRAAGRQYHAFAYSKTDSRSPYRGIRAPKSRGCACKSAFKQESCPACARAEHMNRPKQDRFLHKNELRTARGTENAYLYGCHLIRIVRGRKAESQTATPIPVLRLGDFEYIGARGGQSRRPKSETRGRSSSKFCRRRSKSWSKKTWNTNREHELEL